MPAHPKFDPEHISRWVQNAPHLDTPTVDGYYWCRTDNGSWDIVRLEDKRVYFVGNDLDYKVESFTDWHGPISPPVSANLQKS